MQDTDEGIQKVLREEVNALVADQETTGVAVLRNPGRGLAALTTPLTIEPIGIALPAGDAQLANLVGNYLAALEDAGVLGAARAFWFEDPSWLRELP